MTDAEVWTHRVVQQTCSDGGLTSRQEDGLSDNQGMGAEISYVPEYPVRDNSAECNAGTSLGGVL
jgi:hypothetical protein